ncbi:MAG TPA: DUF2934 domain-containing protein [Bryobacteraceae bacterium]|jgi:hypothetical protein|nr:DUF2934 domain-containing protein [Bryobacteraceae bacterium]
MKSKAHLMHRGIDRTAAKITPKAESVNRPENEVATLAYSYWQQRGCPDGCPEEDWFRAERELSGQTQRNAGTA